MGPRVLWQCSTALALGLLGGCAFLAPEPPIRERLVLERPGDVVTQARAGRFVIRSQSSTADERGAQGRFEWLEYASAPNGRRQVLIWLGPLGQSVASLEQRMTAQATGLVAAFDDRGLRLAQRDRHRFLAAVLGSDVVASVSDQEINAALASLMAFFQDAASTQAARHESQLQIQTTLIHLRIAFDQP
jgi:hypothetical protein